MATQTPLSERDSRFERVRARMCEEGFDALLIGGKGHWWTGRGYVRYLSDFHLWGHDALIVFPVEGEPAITVSSYAVARMIASRGWITDSAGDVFLVPRTLSALRQRGLQRGRLGTVGTPFIMSADLHRELVEQLPSAEIRRADEILDRVRLAKSEIEIFQNRELWDLAKKSMERFADVLRPGHSQLELSAEATKVALAGGARDVLVLMGESPAEYGPPCDEPVRCSDVLRYHMEICGPSGHWCELTLTFSFRPLSESEERLLESELDAYRAVQAAARPELASPSSPESSRTRSARMAGNSGRRRSTSTSTGRGWTSSNTRGLRPSSRGVGRKTSPWNPGRFFRITQHGRSRRDRRGRPA